jgi:VanZ family protein
MAAAWAAAITAGADWPRRPEAINESDKLVHVASYAVLSMLVARAVMDSPRSRARLWLTVFLACVLFGGLDELHQRLIPYRFADVADWLADSLGALIGSVAVYRRRADATDVPAQS